MGSKVVGKKPPKKGVPPKGKGLFERKPKQQGNSAPEDIPHGIEADTRHEDAPVGSMQLQPEQANTQPEQPEAPSSGIKNRWGNPPLPPSLEGRG